MLKNNIKQITAKSAIFNYLGKTLTTVVDAAAFILITKKLMIDDYGVYSFSLAVLSFFAFFISFGIPTSFLRFIPEYIEKNKRDTALSIIKLGLRIITISGFFLIISSFFIADKISFIFKGMPLKELFPLLVFIGIWSIIIKAEEEILNALFLQVFRNICEVLAGLLKLFLFIIILRYRWGINGLLIAIAAVAVFQSLFYFKKIYAYFSGIKSQEKLSKPELRRFSIYSLKEYLYIASAFFWDMSFDIYIIAYLLGPVSTGFFSFASSISFFLLHWSPGVVLQPIVSPLFVRQYSKYNDPAALNNLFQFYNKFKAFFAFPIIFGTWSLVDKFIMIVYHNKYDPAISTLKILVLSVMILAFTIPIRNIFDIFEKNEFSLYSNIVIIYRICASIILIKYFGIIGAAYSYGSSMLLFFLIQLFLVRRIIKITYPIRSFLKILANSLVMVLFLMVLKRFIGDSLFWLIATVMAGILVYLFLSYINKPFKKEERSLINEGLRFQAWHF